MSKLTFKRIALVVVSTLGLGLMSWMPANAAIVASSDTLTLSATTSAISAGESATVTVSTSLIAGAAGDSMAVIVAKQSGPTSGDGKLGARTSDSSNALTDTNCNAYGTAGQFTLSALGGKQRDCQTGTLRDVSLAIPETLAIFTGSTGITAASASYSVAFVAPTVVGTYVFRIYNVNTSGSQAIGSAGNLTWTVTVSANASSVGTTASKFWLNRATEYGAYHASEVQYSNPGTTSYRTIETDSALVVSAGSAATPAIHAVITPVIMNSSDTKISTQTSARVNESMTIVIS